jgi:hypothetical protein
VAVSFVAITFSVCVGGIKRFSYWYSCSLPWSQVVVTGDILHFVYLIKVVLRSMTKLNKSIFLVAFAQLVVLLEVELIQRILANTQATFIMFTPNQPHLILTRYT